MTTSRITPVHPTLNCGKAQCEAPVTSSGTTVKSWMIFFLFLVLLFFFFNFWFYFIFTYLFNVSFLSFPSLFCFFLFCGCWFYFYFFLLTYFVACFQISLFFFLFVYFMHSFRFIVGGVKFNFRLLENKISYFGIERGYEIGCN